MTNKNVIAITMLLIFTFLPVYSSGAQDGKFEQHTINVSGRGEIFITPDVANISFSVETMADTASKAAKDKLRSLSSTAIELQIQSW